jgi:glycosyltransferase involved in cell wall biosynthesis
VHVCLVTEKYPPVVGGGESHIACLAEGLVGRGHAVTILTETPRWVDGRSRASDGIVFCEVPGLVDACERAHFGEALRSLRDALRSAHGVDVAHVFHRVPAALCGLLNGFLPRRTCLSTFETVISRRRVFGLWNDFDLEMEFARNVAALLAPDVMICGSRLYRDWAIEEGYPDHSIRVIPFGTDVSLFCADERLRADYRRRMGWTSSFVVLVPARPIPRKRIEDVVEALPRVLEQVPHTHLVLTDPTNRGDEGYAAWLRRLIDERGLSGDVTWLSGLAVDDMPNVMRASDVAVLPADDDGFGIVLIEAMACGVPVIASDVPGHDEVVTPDTGTLYPRRDIRRLAEALVQSAGGPEHRIVDAARDRVARLFSVQQMVEGHVAVYEEILRRSGARTVHQQPEGQRA